MVQRDEYRQMLLAGTVSFPATFPQVGRLSLTEESLPFLAESSVSFLSVTESPSARVTLQRRVRTAAVRAVFLPNDPRNVNYADGQWLLGDEILNGLTQLLKDNLSLEGIVYVPESEPSMLHVSAGMTAGESVQYYPPLPNDPAHNHYNAWPSAPAKGYASDTVSRSFFSCTDTATDMDSSFPPPEEFEAVSRGFNASALWSCSE